MGILWMLYPPRCALCGAMIEKSRILCDECEEHVEKMSGYDCPICLRKRESCICDHRILDDIACVYYYNTASSKAVKGLKFYNRMQGIVYAAAQMTAYAYYCFPDVKFDFVTCVPLSSRRRRRRGYNQAELLARELAKSMSLPMDAVLKKNYDNPPQSKTGRSRRRGNVAGVMELENGVDVRDRTILLVDDVCTSGSTIMECAKTLKYAGAAAVYCITLAKAGRRPKNETETPA